LTDIGVEMVDPSELAAMEAADAVKLSRQEERRQARERGESLERPTNKRQFRRFDETWAEVLLAADPPVSAAVWRLALVLLAEADFHREILIADDVSAAARLGRSRKRETLERMEQLRLIKVEWRGQGRAARVVPYRLGGRPSRK
ncbi:MAG: hypothetical protein WB611_33870, partial [Stellaceae bacterium]